MNKYYKAIDSVHAKQCSVEKALAAAKMAEQSEKVIETTKAKKRFNIKAVSAIAACMVAIVAGSTIFSNNFSKNSFTIIANAATLNGDSDIYIGELNEIGGYYDKKVKKDGSKEYSYSARFNLVLNCEGDNIKSVKYTGKKCQLRIPDYNAYKNFVRAQFYKSYKVCYDEQHNTDNKIEFELIVTASTDDKNINDETKQAIIDYYSYIIHKPYPYEQGYDDYDDKFDIQKIEKTIFSYLLNKMKIKTEIEFNDGTVKTETIKIICKKFYRKGSLRNVQLNAKIDK